MEKGTIGAVADNGTDAVDPRHPQLYIALVLLVLGLMFAMNAVRADELHLLVNGKAIHFNEQPNSNYNESNWGVGFQYDLGTRDDPWVPFITASEFEDSNRNTSYYAGGGYLRRFHFAGKTGLHADIGVVGFLMVRKGFKDGDPFPGVLPAFSIGTERVALNMTFIPRVDPKMVPLLFLQLKVKLGDF